MDNEEKIRNYDQVTTKEVICKALLQILYWIICIFFIYRILICAKTITLFNCVVVILTGIFVNYLSKSNESYRLYLVNKIENNK